jgi:hypothetical protein
MRLAPTLIRSRLALLVGAALLCGFSTAAQESAALSGDEIVKAGEDFNFTITLDHAPSFDGGGLQVDFSDPDNRAFGIGVGLKKDQQVAHATFHIPVSAVGGRWRVRVTGFHDGFKVVWFKVPAELGFEVIGTPGLIYPTSAQITVNPSQQQFLRKQALRVQGQLQSLKAAVLAERSKGRIQSVLRGSVIEAIKSLNSNEIEFRNLQTGNSDPKPAEVFFDDLRTAYQDLLNQLSRGGVRSRSSSWILAVSTTDYPATDRPEADYPLVAKATFRAFEQNERAYNTVADAQALTFSLVVNSNPSGAVVSYCRKGDPYRKNPDPTNTTIGFLPYAIWTIQFEKVGYKTKEIEHDPFTAPNHVINAELEK